MAASDSEQIRQLLIRYARACDRRDAGLLASCLHDDIEIVLPDLPPMSGSALAENTISMLSDMFEATQHRIFQHDARVEGDQAHCETYCTAAHLFKERRDGKGVIDEWAIRYQDQLVRGDQGWVFTRRELMIDWKEERLVNLT
ncbi:MAG: nuclear transport factor 2 family protein [Pseudomonadales bacterium]